MKKTFSTLFLCCASLALVGLSTACSSDSDQYASVFPQYATLTSTPEVIHVGDTVTFTLVERIHGTNIGSPVYTWSVGELWETPNALTYTSPRLYSESGHPTCKVVATTRGKHKVVFTGKWSVNGQAQSAPAPFIKDGLSVTSTASTLNYFVTASKEFTVLP